MYKTGSTGRTKQIPSNVTVQNTEDIFRIHILPMFGDYSIKWFNENKELVLRQLTSLS